MKTLLNIPFLFIILALGGVSAFSQVDGKTASKALPFASGEKLTYEAKISRLKIGVAIADLSFAVDAVPNSQNYLIKTKADSKGTLLKLFRFSFLQEFESLVDFSASRIIKTTKHDVQKERVRDSVADFDYSQKRVTYVEMDPKNTTRPPRRIASQIEDQTYDLASGIYALRKVPLTVGKSFEITISDSGLVYTLPVRVTAREQQKSILGKQWCFRVEPVIFGNGRLIEQKGSLIIWFTDDDRRVPVRSQINTTYGKIDIRLKSISN